MKSSALLATKLFSTVLTVFEVLVTTEPAPPAFRALTPPFTVLLTIPVCLIIRSGS